MEVEKKVLIDETKQKTTCLKAPGCHTGCFRETREAASTGSRVHNTRTDRG